MHEDMTLVKEPYHRGYSSIVMPTKLTSCLHTNQTYKMGQTRMLIYGSKRAVRRAQVMFVIGYRRVSMGNKL